MTSAISVAYRPIKKTIGILSGFVPNRYLCTAQTEKLTLKHYYDYGKEMALYRMRVHSRRSRGSRAVPALQGRQRQVRGSCRRGGNLDFVTVHKLGDGKGASKELWEGLQNHFMGECTEVGMYLAMSRQADREGYPEIAEAYKRYAWEEAEHASKSPS